MRFAGRTVLVTGGGRGIGRAIARAFAGEGAEVAVNDIDLGAAEAAASEIREKGGRALALRADVSKSEEVGPMVESILQTFGKIDILVNNAGGSDRERSSLFCESTEDVWDFAIGRNLKGTLICSRAVINHMIQRRYGKIINISSVAAIASGGPKDPSGQVVYSAAKGGIISFTRKLAKEVGPYGINVNCISPGTVETAAFQHVPKEYIESHLERIVLGRAGRPEEVASLVLFLASDEASFILGQNYIIDGGLSL